LQQPFPVMKVHKENPIKTKYFLILLKLNLIKKGVMISL
jgi:hypothetical protein